MKNLYLNALRRTYHAIGTDETRSNLCAIHVDVDARAGTLPGIVTVDGHRLAFENVNGEIKTSRTLAFTKQTRKPRSEEDALRFLRDGKETELTFPDWRLVVPTREPKIRGTVDRKAFLEACQHIQSENTIEEERQRAPVMLARAQAEVAYFAAYTSHGDVQGKPTVLDQNRLAVARADLAAYDRDAKSIDGCVLDVGDSIQVQASFEPRPNVTVPIERATASRASVRCAVNAGYLVDALESFRVPRLVLEMHSELEPIVLRSETGFDLIMPIRI